MADTLPEPSPDASSDDTVVQQPVGEALDQTHDEVLDEVLALQVAAGAMLMDYGKLKLVESFDHYEAEYAVIRKGVGLLDTPQLGVVRLTGAERADFLHRFVTNEVNKVQAGRVTRAFWLGRNGRINADMLVLVLEKELLLVLDRHDTGNLSQQLEKFLFAEDVVITDQSETMRQFSLHGPQAALLLASVGGEGLHELNGLDVREATLAGRRVTVYRHDTAGAMGLHVVCRQEDALAIWQALVEVLGGLCPEVEGGVRRRVTGRGIGWIAYNTARIEAGSPVYHIDFGPDSLPHETSLISQAVSFTKGCYVGQEIVARMHNLGHPKKKLVKLRFEDDRLPLAGGQVFAEDGSTLVGAVTSSCLSPLGGNDAIALAMVKWGRHTPGTTLRVTAEGSNVPATVVELGV